MLVDTHCHLNFDWFDADRRDVIARARQAGIERLVNPGIDIASSRAAVQLAEAHSEIYAAVGVHPNDALSWNDQTADELRELAKHPKVVAIGEIGLDYYRDRSPHDLQQKIFLNQLHLAAELKLPVIIHSRNASTEDRRAVEDILAMLAELQQNLITTRSPLAERAGVLHSFSGDLSSALRAIELKFFIGVTGPVTFRNAPEQRRLVEELPLDQLLVETDAPFLTPHPYRGQRNEPAYVRLVAEMVSEIHHLPFDYVADITTVNAGRLFNW